MRQGMASLPSARTLSGKTLFQSRQSILIDGALQISRPHDKRIFVIVGIIATARAHHSEAVLLIEILGGGIRFTYLQSDPACSPLDSLIDKTDQQLFSKALALMFGIYRHGRDMRVFQNHPKSAVPDDRIAKAADEVMGELVLG